MPSYKEAVESGLREVSEGRMINEHFASARLCYEQELSSNKAFRNLKLKIESDLCSGTVNNLDAQQLVNNGYDSLKDSMNSDENLCTVTVTFVNGETLQLDIPLFYLMQEVPSFYGYGDIQINTPKQSLISEFIEEGDIVPKKDLLKVTTVGDVKELIRHHKLYNSNFMSLASDKFNCFMSDDEDLERLVDININRPAELEFSVIPVEYNTLPTPSMQRSKGEKMDALVFQTSLGARENFINTERNRLAERGSEF